MAYLSTSLPSMTVSQRGKRQVKQRAGCNDAQPNTALGVRRWAYCPLPPGEGRVREYW